MIRAATETDVPAIVAMSRKFYATTDFPGFADMDNDTVAELVRTLMHSVMLVAEEGGELVGMVGAIVAPFMFNQNRRAAYEVVWWVEPGVQRSGLGRSLLRAADEAAAALGASGMEMLTLDTSPPQAAALLASEGYRPAQTSHFKRLNPHKEAV
ncbi:N-acetyltransferase family protein [Xanthomonas sp. WHRI 7945]|nr:GNAT family N-acetyltransferase [Xanthomonas campestris pv. campestris]